MTGRAMVGTWVIGRRDGEAREIFLYQTTDAEEIWRTAGLGAVAWQTGFNPVIAMELLASGAWSGAGVLGPEAFDPDPYIGLLDRYGIHHGIAEMEPGRHRPT
jgi:saccharopine dehydrogenase (NAD+, L-lysine forming)